MALKISTNYNMFDDRTGRHYCIQTVDYDGTSTTVNIPEGPIDGAVLSLDPSGNTEPTVTVSNSTLLATLAAGGTSGTYFLVTLHVGSAAGL